ncbi:MAG: hypothetical protein H7X97_05455, partial [Opitutaceae bacterium]|nr:hypothetical protein [Verrucomicrobiales bacterium]
MNSSSPPAPKRSNRPASPLRLLIWVNSLQAWRRLIAVREQSKLLTVMIGLFVMGYLLLAFWLFQAGLGFVSTFPGLGTILIERLLFLLFAFLFILLLFSNLIISYTNLFRNRETHFLLSLPISTQTIFRWKFLESVLLASWAFLFLISPLLAAYGLRRGVPWHFYFAATGLVGLFIVLPGVAGAWAAITLARHMDRRSFQILGITSVILAVVATSIWMKPEPVADDLPETRILAVMDRLLMRTSFSQYPLLPSYWLSTSVLQWAEGALAAASFFALVLLSHTLFFGYLAFTTTGRIFYDAFSSVQSRSSVFGRWDWFRRRQQQRQEFNYPIAASEKLLNVARWIRPEVRSLLLKDARLFWRDTTQWGQTLVLFGLLGVYIINLRHFSQQLTNPFWVNLVSFLNLGACSLNLATLTTRFVYPQFSLEGKRLWIVGMAPLGLPAVVRTKFWQATMASMAITVGLMALSCQMLKLDLDRIVFFCGVVAVMTMTLNGLAIGLGVLHPNLREDNPSKIVSGFGGTFCLVLSFLYIVASVILLALGSPWGRYELTPMRALICWGGFAILSISLGRIPLKLAYRRLQ